MRNSYLFRNQRLHSSMVVETALTETRLYQITSTSPYSARQRALNLNPDQLWRPPDLGTLKCNVDASYQPESTEGALAAVFRDHQGRLTEIYTKRFPVASALVAEFQALSFAIQHLIAQGLQHARVVIESDCRSVVDAITGRRSAPWELRPLLAEAAELLPLFPNLTIQWCPREANGVADWAAKAQRDSTLAHNWNIFPPLILMNLIYVDALLAGCKMMFL
ncbi:uncharacterized protein LOC104417207 [Eucalyptus grandis]|uniref:uncharacterized protein LOC104417207 n=1 Tax=Eucalyptus grandis TaxID=71139 RepID=UPI00192E86B8|nr:uncharacterized protein LOC104417207 [Eucalyptus grandis]